MQQLSTLDIDQVVGGSLVTGWVPGQWPIGLLDTVASQIIGAGTVSVATLAAVSPSPITPSVGLILGSPFDRSDC